MAKLHWNLSIWQSCSQVFNELENHLVIQEFVQSLSLVCPKRTRRSGTRASAIDAISSGSIINIVKIQHNLLELIGTDLSISHQGILVRKNGKMSMRHASREAGKVKESLLLNYLEWGIEDPSIDMKGFNILFPLEKFSDQPRTW